MICRAVFAKFKGLQYQGYREKWGDVGDMFWGYPEMLGCKPPYISNRLAESELVFGTLKDAQADWEAFQSSPVPLFAEVCDEIFGDG